MPYLIDVEISESGNDFIFLEIASVRTCVRQPVQGRVNRARSMTYIDNCPQNPPIYINGLHEVSTTRDRGQIDAVEERTAERAMEPIAIGRKNYLFVGSEGGGKSAAIIVTENQTALMRRALRVSCSAARLSRNPKRRPDRLR